MTGVNILLVGLGSAVGALLRYVISQQINKVNNRDFPWSTFLINMCGSFVLGLLFQELTVLHHQPNLWLVLGTGFCGSFTTFSTMSVEMVQLYKRHFLLGTVYVGSSLALGFLLAWLPRLWLPL